MATASDVMIETLLEWGVDTIFGLPGDGIDNFFASLRTHQDKMRFVQVRHEEAAAFSACAYAKFTGQLGACVATSGPGAVHLLNGLYDAKMDGAPVLAITGQQPRDLLGFSYVQDINTLSLYEDVAAYNQLVTGTESVRNLTTEACRVALAKQTVTHLSFPFDVQGADMESDYYQHTGGPPRMPARLVDAPAPFYTRNGHGPSVAPLPSEDALKRAADILNAGSRVAILAGHGALGARREIEQVADLLAAPVVKSLLGKSLLPDDSPYTTGGIGLLGTQPSTAVMDRCDTLFLIGTSYPWVRFLPQPGQARGVQIDLDQTRLGLRFPVDVGLVGDARDTLRALISHLERKSDRSFLQFGQNEMKGWNAYLEKEATSDAKPMKPQVVVRALEKHIAPNAIVCADTGTVTTWIAQYLHLGPDQMFSASGTLATMGNGLPYANGAQIAYPNRQVIAFCGDGGFSMTMMEMLTAVKYDLPIKVIVIKNNALAEIKWEQIIFSASPQYAVELQPADFAGWARAAGATGFSLDDPSQADSVMAQFLATPGPALLEAVTDPNAPPLPPTIFPNMAVNFAEALARGEPGGVSVAKHAFRDKIEEWWTTTTE